jgi:hypothetical protein
VRSIVYHYYRTREYAGRGAPRAVETGRAARAGPWAGGGLWTPCCDTTARRGTYIVDTTYRRALYIHVAYTASRRTNVTIVRLVQLHPGHPAAPLPTPPPPRLDSRREDGLGRRSAVRSLSCGVCTGARPTAPSRPRASTEQGRRTRAGPHGHDSTLKNSDRDASSRKIRTRAASVLWVQQRHCRLPGSPRVHAAR